MRACGGGIYSQPWSQTRAGQRAIVDGHCLQSGVDASAFRSVDDLCVHVDCSEEDGFVIEWWGLSEEERHGLGFSGRFD